MQLYLLVNMSLFIALAVFHVGRLAFDWTVRIGEVAVAYWVSWPLLVLALVMFIWSVRLYQADSQAKPIWPEDSVGARDHADSVSAHGRG